MPPIAPADLDHVLQHTRDLWRELSDARIFVTGGTGFFGCWLMESFVWARDQLGLNASITVLTRSPEAFREKAPHLVNHPAVHLVSGDVRSFAVAQAGFTHVIHAATPSSGTATQDSLLMLDTIIEGTRHTLDFAAAAGARRFLFTSSGAVYGTQPSHLSHVPETYFGAPDPSDTKKVYGAGKRLAETLCCIYGQTTNVQPLIARCFAFVGAHLPLDQHFAIGNFIDDCLNNRGIQIRGDGTPRRSYLYAADLAIWLWTILVRGEPARPYNVGANQDLSIAEVARAVTAVLNPAAEIRIAGIARPDQPTEKYVPETERAHNELGLRQFISVPDAIRRTAEWYRQSSAGPASAFRRGTFMDTTLCH